MSTASNYGAPQAQQYYAPQLTHPPPTTQFPPPPRAPPAASQPYATTPVTSPTLSASGKFPQPTSAILSPSQLQGYGFPPGKSPLQDNTYPPPPNAPPTPAYTSTCATPLQHMQPTNDERWTANGQPMQYQPVNAPPTPIYSPPATVDGRSQASYQAPINLPPTPQYSPAAFPPPPTSQYTPAAYGYGGSVPQAPVRNPSSYFPQQSQSLQTQQAPTQQSLSAPNYDQHPTATSPHPSSSVQLDLSKLSLNEPPPLHTIQHSKPSQTQTSLPKPAPAPTHYPNVSQEKAELPQAYSQLPPSGSNSQSPQQDSQPHQTQTSSIAPAPDPTSNPTQEKTKLEQEYAQLSSSAAYPQESQKAAQPAATPFSPPPTMQFPPPPPYSPNTQPIQELNPSMKQEFQPLQSAAAYNQQQPQHQWQSQYQQQHMQQQAQAYVQQQTPYHGGLQQQQYTQVQVQYPVMGLQQPQYAQAQVQQVQQVQPPEQAQWAQQTQPAYGQDVPAGALAHKPGKDDEQTGKVTRFLGDTLVGRFARSGVSTVTTTLKMPATLSPWGDNNPVTLPNVRYRDAILFGTFAVVGAPIVDGVSDAVTSSFGADHFVSEIVSSGAGFITGNTIVKYGVFQIVEQAIDKGILEHVLPEVEKTMRTTTAKTLQVSIKHKLMGVEADIRMHAPYPAAHAMACDKGWFAPYLFASSRTPVIKRSEDFAIAQFFKPYLMADTHLTHKLLTESASVIPLCDPAPDAHLSHARLMITFIGISPFRGEGSGIWSTSRRPGCGQLRIHMFNGCPTLVVPAYSDAQRTPVIAWSPWTLKQMHEGSGQVGLGAPGQYTPQKQHQEICSWLLGLVDRRGLHPSVANNAGSLERLVGKVVTMIINGAMTAPKGGKVCGVVDSERAGIVVLRY